MNIYEKISKVSLEVKNIAKDMTVGSGSYSYKAVSDLVVTIAVKEAEAKYGLVSIPIKQELIKSEVYKSVKKESYNGRETEKEMFTYVDDIKMVVRIINIEKPEEFIDVETYGKGIDSGDKGFGKASTYARKYALLNAYKIATGDDPDKDASPTEPIDKRKVEKAEKKNAEPNDDDIDKELVDATMEIKNANSLDELRTIWTKHKKLQNNDIFISVKEAKKLFLTKTE